MFTKKVNLRRSLSVPALVEADATPFAIFTTSVIIPYLGLLQYQSIHLDL